MIIGFSLRDSDLEMFPSPRSYVYYKRLSAGFKTGLKTDVIKAIETITEKIGDCT